MFLILVVDLSSRVNNDSQNQAPNQISYLGNKKRTQMILAISLVTLIGHVPNSVSFIMFPFNLLNFYDYNYYLIFCNSLLFISHSNYGIIFLVFDENFKAVFYRLLRLN